MLLVEGLCQLLRSRVESIAAGDWIGGHGFSTVLSKCKQRPHERSANLSLPRNAASKGRGKRQPLRLAQAITAGAPGINRLGAVVVPRKKFHGALTLFVAHKRPPGADLPSP